jgi:hypothetical protein
VGKSGAAGSLRERQEHGNKLFCSARNGGLTRVSFPFPGFQPKGRSLGRTHVRDRNAVSPSNSKRKQGHSDARTRARACAIFHLEHLFLFLPDAKALGRTCEKNVQGSFSLKHKATQKGHSRTRVGDLRPSLPEAKRP